MTLNDFLTNKNDISTLVFQWLTCLPRSTEAHRSHQNGWSQIWKVIGKGHLTLLSTEDITWMPINTNDIYIYTYIFIYKTNVAWCRHMSTYIWVSIPSCKGLIPGGTKPLPEPIQTNPLMHSSHRSQLIHLTWIYINISHLAHVVFKKVYAEKWKSLVYAPFRSINNRRRWLTSIPAGISMLLYS